MSNRRDPSVHLDGLKRPAAVLMAAAMVFSPSAASAHHGFTGRYDASAPLWIEGEVVSAHIGPPHIEVRLRTPARFSAPGRASLDGLAGALRPTAAPPTLRVRADHMGATLLLEFPPIGAFTGLRGRLRVGDRVSAVVYRNCNAPHNLRVQWFKVGDGPALPGRRNVQTEVERC
jgi:hypothetical protein